MITQRLVCDIRARSRTQRINVNVTKKRMGTQVSIEERTELYSALNQLRRDVRNLRQECQSLRETIKRLETQEEQYEFI